MKKIFASIIILLNINLFSQTVEISNSLSPIKIGVFGGVNFENFSNICGSVLVEGKYNLFSNFYLKLSLGYTKTIEETNYTVKSNGKRIIDNVETFFAASDNIIKREYDVMPISFGTLYILNEGTISPYGLFDLSYNILNKRLVKTGGQVWTYTSYEYITEEFKHPRTEIFPDNSYGFSVGIGTFYKLKKKLHLDFRYFYKYDSEIIGTHNILVGIFL